MEVAGCIYLGLRVEATSNLFLENLHNTRQLETIYYVTDVKQQTDFFWYRESGVRINIGLQNVNVVPLYEDIEHRADNNFVSGSPHSDDDKAWFDEVTRRHCRCAPGRRVFSRLSRVLRITFHHGLECICLLYTSPSPRD